MAYRGWSIEVKGSKVMRDIFESVGKGTFMRALSGGLYAEANRVMAESKREVPLEDGPLRASGTVMPAQVTGTKFSITLGYGGAASAYALIQHENMGFSHPGRDSKRVAQTGRKAKYLEDPVKRALPNLEARLRMQVRSYFTPFTG